MSHGGRRVIQPPGGASNIFFGGDEPASNGSGKGQKNGQTTVDNQADAQADAKKQTSESAESTLGKSNSDQSGHANTESNRNKDRQKSSIVFGNDDSGSHGGAASKPGQNDSASQSAANNKAGQTHRSYNIMTGEAYAEEPSKKPNPTTAANGNDKQQEGAPVPGTTSIKVHHPPGGKSSGPLW